MTGEEGVRKKRYWLFLLAVGLLLFAGWLLFWASDSYVIRTIGVLIGMVSVYLVRASNVHTRAAPDTEARSIRRKSQATGLGRAMRVTSLVLIPLLGLSFYFLYRDAMHGYEQVWPVYAFAGVAVACAIVWSYEFSRLFK